MAYENQQEHFTNWMTEWFTKGKFDSSSLKEIKFYYLVQGKSLITKTFENDFGNFKISKKNTTFSYQFQSISIIV